MLKSLTIQNIVLIDKAEINFANGLCILSGETGSGKSILLDALGLAIGFRSSIRLIGSDENKALVTAEFDISNNEQCKNFLKENDLLGYENSSELRIRRLIQENSSSKVYVNDQLVGVNLLAKIGETLLEIHGQHDQRGLLNSSFHGEILDQFAQNDNLLKELKIIYENLKEIDRKISEFLQQKEQAAREKDYLEHIINELESANVKIGEEEELISKRDVLAGKTKIFEFLNNFKQNLLEASSQMALGQKVLIRNQNLISNYLASKKDEFEKFSDMLDKSSIDLDSLQSFVDDIIDEITSSEDSLEEIEERLFLIRSLMRKFNTTCDCLGQILEEAKTKLALLKNEEEINEQFQEEKDLLLKNYHQIAEKLSKKRKDAALILAKKVEEELDFLKMSGVKFLVEVENAALVNGSEYFANGYDKIRFLASINKNNFDEIAKIASGGELSRFMLALKVALMNVKSVPTMIFDEIDTGIGGSTADAVGKRLKILSQNLQILVVTHQPQIAAKANLHFKISKSAIADQKVKTKIEALDEKSRQKEIARMLSGEEISDEALAAAAKLITPF